VSVIPRPHRPDRDLVFTIDYRGRWRSPAGSEIAHILPPFWIEISAARSWARVVRTAQSYDEARLEVLKLMRAERDSGRQCWAQDYAARLRGAQ
jgi:hypothetical protein